MKITFLKNRIKGQLAKNKSVRESTPYTNAKTIGIIFTIEDRLKHDLIKDLIHKLEHDGKKVQVMTFLPNKKENYDFLFDFFTMKEVSFWGSIESHNAIKFADTSFDYLLCLDQNPVPMVSYLVARSKAKCRIGRFNEENKSFFEFMIDVPNTKGLLDGIYKYTTQLK